jgi:hypothetical protein
MVGVGGGHGRVFKLLPVDEDDLGLGQLERLVDSGGVGELRALHLA